MKFYVSLPGLLFFLAQPSLGQDPMDGYYSNDLLDAVHEAKQAPHHYDYSNTYRYKRTTAQSIELDRLDLGELDDTMLSSALDAPEESESIAYSDSLTHSKDAELDQPSGTPATRKYSLPIQPITSGSSAVITPNGTMSTQGIQNSSTLVSTPRP